MSKEHLQTEIPSVPGFSILWVDDHPEAIERVERGVLQWFSNRYKNENLELQIRSVRTEAEALKESDDFYFDLIITDYDLGHGMPDGSDLVRKIRRKSNYTDIIFYTRRPNLPSGIDVEVYRAGFVEVVLNDQLVPTAEAVIQARLERFQKVSFLRGLVISAFIDLESSLNEFLMNYFCNDNLHQSNFKTSILENKYIPFGAKVNVIPMLMYGKLHPKKTDAMAEIFESAIDYKTFNDALDKLRVAEEHRNCLAHSNFLANGQLEVLSMGEKKIYKRANVMKIIEELAQCIAFINKLNSCLMPSNVQSATSSGT